MALLHPLPGKTLCLVSHYNHFEIILTSTLPVDPAVCKINSALSPVVIFEILTQGKLLDCHYYCTTENLHSNIQYMLEGH